MNRHGSGFWIAVVCLCTLAGAAAVGADGPKPVAAPGDEQARAAVRRGLDWLKANQAKDGSWVNDDNTFWEGDASLVTSYSVLALQMALGR